MYCSLRKVQFCIAFCSWVYLWSRCFLQKKMQSHFLNACSQARELIVMMIPSSVWNNTKTSGHISVFKQTEVVNWTYRLFVLDFIRSKCCLRMTTSHQNIDSSSLQLVIVCIHEDGLCFALAISTGQLSGGDSRLFALLIWKYICPLLQSDHTSKHRRDSQVQVEQLILCIEKENVHKWRQSKIAKREYPTILCQLIKSSFLGLYIIHKNKQGVLQIFKRP